MRKIRQIFIVTLFVLTFISLSSASANAQQLPPSYLFLEVLDSNGKPVAGATINNSTVQTDEQGQAKLSYNPYDRQPFTREFTIAKSGYFPYQDLGVGDERFSRARSAKIELLKIPQTKSERAALGDEQLKREFFSAIQNADVQTIRKLLKSGISPNISTKDLRGFSKAQPNDFDAVPAIVYAASSGSGETVKTLLRAGADVRPRRNPYIDSILFFYLSADAFEKPKSDTEAEKTKLMREYEDGLKELIKAGAYVNAGDYSSNNRDDNTALMVAVRKGYLEAVKILIDSGASVAAPNLDTITPLMVAAQWGNTEIAKLLIEKGVPVNAQDAHGRTALMYVGYYNIESKIRMADLLLKSGADPNIINKHSGGGYYILQQCKTALILAVTNNDLEMTRFLLANKADVNLACENGDTALKYAKQIRGYGIKNQEIIKMLEAAGAK